MDVQAQHPLPALKDAYNGFFQPGCVLSSNDIDADAWQELRRHVTAVTPGFSMNPYPLQPSGKRPPYMVADHFVSQAQQAGLDICGSALVWNGSLPAALPGMDAESFVRHLGDACLHYAHRVSAWVVVSDALLGTAGMEGWRSAVKECLWSDAFGGREKGSYYIDSAFRTARGTAPGAKLFYGENIFEAEGKTGVLNPHKLQNLMALVSDINRRYRGAGFGRNLIEGISLRAHFTADTAMNEVRSALCQLAALGLELEISGFHVSPSPQPLDMYANAETEDECVRRKTAELLCLFRSWSEHIVRVGFAQDVLSAAAKEPEYAAAITEPEVYLGREPMSPPAPRPIAKAIYAGGRAPFIDGAVEELWSEAEPIHIMGFRQRWNSASGTARMLWDDENLYVLVEISDDSQDCSSPLAHEHDSVEVYINETGHYDSFFTAGDGLYRVDCENSRSVGINARNLGFESAVRNTAQGYTVEMRIPLHVRRLEIGFKLGFDIQINDAEGSTRVGMATWHTREGEALRDPTIWGRLELCRYDNQVEEWRVAASETAEEAACTQTEESPEALETAKAPEISVSIETAMTSDKPDAWEEYGEPEVPEAYSEPEIPPITEAANRPEVMTDGAPYNEDDPDTAHSRPSLAELLHMALGSYCTEPMTAESGDKAPEAGEDAARDNEEAVGDDVETIRDHAEPTDDIEATGAETAVSIQPVNPETIHKAEIALEALSAIDEAEAALDNINAVDQAIAAAHIVESPPKRQGKRLFIQVSARRSEYPPKHYTPEQLRLFLGLAALGTTAYVLYRLSKRQK